MTSLLFIQLSRGQLEWGVASDYFDIAIEFVHSSDSCAPSIPLTSRSTDVPFAPLPQEKCKKITAWPRMHPSGEIRRIDASCPGKLVIWSAREFRSLSLGSLLFSVVVRHRRNRLCQSPSSERLFRQSQCPT